AAVVADRVDGAGEHVGLHHHAGPAASRGVVHGAVPVGRMRADIARLQRPQAARQRLAGEALPKRAGKHLRKDGQHGGAPHGRHSTMSGGTTTILPPAISISGTAVSVNGTLNGAPPAASAISITSPAPKFWIAVTLPKGS